MPAAPAFDAAQATWMQSGCVSVMVASRTDSNRPAIGVSFGCRISTDRCQVTLFLGAAANRELIAALQLQRPIAVVVTESATTRSIQLKAENAEFVALAPGDRERMRAYVGALAQTWALGGRPLDWTRALLDTSRSRFSSSIRRARTCSPIRMRSQSCASPRPRPHTGCT